MTKIRFRHSVDFSDLSIACHEASHACYRIVRTGGNAKAVVKATMGPEGHQHVIAFCEYSEEMDEDFLRLVECLVGEAAELAFFGEDWKEDSHDQDDAMDIAWMIDRSSAWAVLERAKDEAIAFVQRYETAIRAIGARLCRVGEMSGAEIASMMKKYPPRRVKHDRERTSGI